MNKKSIISFIITFVIVVPVAVILRMNDVDGWVYFACIVGAYALASWIASLVVKEKDQSN